MTAPQTWAKRFFASPDARKAAEMRSSALRREGKRLDMSEMTLDVMRESDR